MFSQLIYDEMPTLSLENSRSGYEFEDVRSPSARPIGPVRGSIVNAPRRRSREVDDISNSPFSRPLAEIFGELHDQIQSDRRVADEAKVAVSNQVIEQEVRERRADDVRLMAPSRGKRVRRDKGVRSEYWCFTLNNPLCEVKVFEEAFLEHFPCSYLVFQLEKGENGTPHFQGYCEMQSRTYFEDLKAFMPEIHWEQRKGSAKQASDYCQKEESRIDGPWITGACSFQSAGRRNDLETAIETLKSTGFRACAEHHPSTFVKYFKGLEKLLEVSFQPKRQEDKTCVLHYGPTGTGKTYWIFEKEPSFASIPTGAGMWFNGYYGQDAVLFDDFDGKGWNMNTFLTMLHTYSSSQPIKGGFTQFTAKRIYFTSNLHPKQWFNLEPDNPQWPAIKRRFSTVRFYTGEREYRELTPDHPKWDHFWVGARGMEDPWTFLKFDPIEEL